MRAVLLAGGRGTRLQPYTATLPKPLVPLDDVPVIDVLLRQLRFHGISDVTVVTGHLAELIRAYLGDGQRYGMRFEYFREQTPLDTAGCLGLIERPAEPFLVMNGDLLTTLDFSALVRYHLRHRPSVTIASYRRKVTVELGVLEIDQDGRLLDYVEKPTYEVWVSMGIYCMEPAVCELVRAGERISMPALILRLRDAGNRIRCYQEDCYWLDIGRPDDYALAVEQFQRDRSRFLPGRMAA